MAYIAIAPYMAFGSQFIPSSTKGRQVSNGFELHRPSRPRSSFDRTNTILFLSHSRKLRSHQRCATLTKILTERWIQPYIPPVAHQRPTQT